MGIPWGFNRGRRMINDKWLMRTQNVQYSTLNIQVLFYWDSMGIPWGFIRQKTPAERLGIPR
jgi:hypothetical protein